MIIAVHPENIELYDKKHPMCFSQGQLIYALNKNPCEEVLLDETLPGHLRPEDLIAYIQRTYPDTVVTIIGKEEVIQKSVFAIASKKLYVSQLFTGLSIVVSYYLLTMGSSQSFVPLSISVLLGTVIGVILLR